MVNNTAVSATQGRQKKLMMSLIEEYIETAEPVGSKFLAYTKNIGWSEATIRNDLRALEEAGLLVQPHTSAGRIPTALGFRFYVDSMVSQKMDSTEEKIIKQAVGQSSSREGLCKLLAKQGALITREAVIVAFSMDKFFYTGLSNLFEKPEFSSVNMVINTSRMFDQCEECLEQFAKKAGDEVNVYIGEEHPFGSHLSVVSFRFEKNRDGFFMVFGPMRMNYKKNLAVVKKIKEIIN